MAFYIYPFITRAVENWCVHIALTHATHGRPFLNMWDCCQAEHTHEFKPKSRWCANNENVAARMPFNVCSVINREADIGGEKNKLNLIIIVQAQIKFNHVILKWRSFEGFRVCPHPSSYSADQPVICAVNDILIMEGAYGTMSTLHGQNLYTPHHDTLTGCISAGVTATSHYFPQKWRVIFSLFEILGLSTDRHNKM